MKTRKTRLFLLSAIVLSFVIAQSASAHMQSIEGPYEVSGTVAYTWGDRLAINCGYTVDSPDSFSGCPLVVSGMGPAAWWSVNEVTFPAAGQQVIISIYRITSDLGDTKFVAGELIANSEGQSLLLRIPGYDGDGVLFVLDPAWSEIGQLAEATSLLSAPTEDAKCTCECVCKDGECDCDCLCDYDDCTPVGDEHKWAGEK